MSKSGEEIVKDSSSKTYVIQRRIECGMIATFVISLLIILGVSIFFFYYFLDQTLEMSVENVFIAATFSVVKDIVQVKKNDFMLAQNELLISQNLILELIKG